MKIAKRLAALCAVFLLALPFGTVAFAGGGPETPEEIIEPVVPEPEPNPFTPDGTGTVLDNATDEDGKEFFTIITPDENVFYLIIDRQRNTENVYFLNAVTERDLLALAEKSGDMEGSISAIPEVPADPEPIPEPDPEPEPEPDPPKSSNTGMIILVVAVVLIGGGAGYYLKIYRPKQLADTGDEYDYEADSYEEYEPEDDAPPWFDEAEDSEESGGNEE